MTLGERIRTARQAAGFTSQLALAQACGWDSASRIGNYEQDTREPSLADLRLIAEATKASGFSYAWIVLGPDELPRASQFERLEAGKIASAMDALNAALAGRPGQVLDLSTPEDAELLVVAYSLLEQAPGLSPVAYGVRIAQLLEQRQQGAVDGERHAAAGAVDRGPGKKDASRRAATSARRRGTRS